MSMAKATHHETPPEDRLPLKEKLGFAIGNVGGAGAAMTAGGLINFIFNMELGVSPALISTIGFVQTILSSVLDPFLGQFSDNFRSRWGRRRPFMIVAGVPMVLLAGCVYAFPRGMSEHGLFWWLFVSQLVFSMVGSLYFLGLGALGIEATRDYHERVRITTFIMFFTTVFGLTTQWIYPAIKSSAFPDTITGLRWVVGGITIFLAFCVLVPIFLCPERRYAQVKKIQPKSPLLLNFKEASKNGQFLTILSIKFFTFFCYSLVGSLGIYMNTYFVYGGDKAKASVTYAVLGSSYIVAAVGSLFVYQKIANALGKRRVLKLAAAVLMCGCICKLFVYDPRHPWLQLIVLMANGASVQGLHLMTGSMFGDIIDYDEWLYGKRREALYGSIFSFSEKVGASCGALLLGFLLVWIGFDAKIAGAQAPRTLRLMQLCYFLFPFLGALFAFIMAGRYKLSEERVYEIRDELAKRHAAAHVPDEAVLVVNPNPKPADAVD